MDKEKKRKFHLMLYGIAIPVSLSNRDFRIHTGKGNR